MLIHAQAGGLITGSSFHRGMYKKTVPLGSPGKGGEGLQCVERTYEPERTNPHHSTGMYWLYITTISPIPSRRQDISHQNLLNPQRPRRNSMSMLLLSEGHRGKPPWEGLVSLLTTLPRHHSKRCLRFRKLYLYISQRQNGHILG